MKKIQLLFAVVIVLIAAACSQSGSNKSAESMNDGVALSSTLDKELSPGEARVIDRNTAETIIRNWYKDNACLPIDSAGDTIVSYFIDKKTLMTLAAKESSDGIRLYLAKSPEHGGMTMVLCGTTPKSTDPSVHNNDLSVIYEYIGRCPDECNGDAANELYFRK